MDSRIEAAERVGRRTLHALLLTSAILVSQPAAAFECVVSQEMLEAYASIRDVSSEVKRLQAQGFEATGVQCVEISGGCGFAGCAASVLVIQMAAKR